MPNGRLPVTALSGFLGQGARDACVHGRDGVALPVRGPVGGP
ncbi:hypothetical protein ABZ800_03770 [Streptomyces sp. NPDC047813]